MIALPSFLTSMHPFLKSLSVKHFFCQISFLNLHLHIHHTPTYMIQDSVHARIRTYVPW